MKVDMKVYYFWFLLSLLLPLPVLGAGVIIINEVAWMGSLPKVGETATQAANNEWVELKNTTSASVDLSGWKLVAQDGTPDIILAGTIAASGFFLLERTSDDTVFGIQADQIYVGALSNSGEILILKDSLGNEVDRVDGSNGWKINGSSESIGNNETKETAQRAASGWITASFTPRAENSTAAVSSSLPTASSTPTPQSQPVGQTPASVISTPLPTIKVYAGEDKTVAAGSLTEFMGEAISVKNEPLINPRFWWNFGDGASKEGHLVSHIFQIPGKYTVGMHVSLGSDARSDYLSVTVVPNQIKMKNVLIGEEGYLTLFNPVETEFDIGEWILEDGAGRKFFLPSRTKIGPKAEIALANRVTGLFKDGEARVTLRYPNSLLAIEWMEEVLKTSPVVQAASSSPKEVVKAVLLPKESALITTTVAATVPEGLAQISSPSLNFSSKIFFFLAILISFVSALSYLVIKLFK